MAIEDRKLVGVSMVEARYKGETHSLVVERDAADHLSFLTPGGIRYTSLSAAGSAIMGGIACNGWRFWTPEGQLPAERAAAVKPVKAPRAAGGIGRREPKAIFPIKSHPAPDGQAFYFCGYCLDGFYAPSAIETPACPGCRTRMEDQTRGMTAAREALEAAADIIAAHNAPPPTPPTEAEAARAVCAALAPKTKKAKTLVAAAKEKTMTVDDLYPDAAADEEREPDDDELSEAMEEMYASGDIPEGDDELYAMLDAVTPKKARSGKVRQAKVAVG